MMDTTVQDGFVVVPCSGDGNVEIGYSNVVGKKPDRWYPAYLDYHNGQRVAKIRVPERLSKVVMYQVYLRDNGLVTKVGKISA
jgi:hypothetical protein